MAWRALERRLKIPIAVNVPRSVDTVAVIRAMVTVFHNAFIQGMVGTFVQTGFL